MYYVSYITEYPIYEPAEGGYYYAGELVQECRAFTTWRKARQYYQKLRAWFLAEHDDEPERLNDFFRGGCDKDGDGPFVDYYSRYIGEGERIQITKTRPEDKGWHPYC